MSDVLTKLMIVPWAGPLPDWIGAWLANTAAVRDAGHGWDFLLDVDMERFRERVEELGVTCPPLEGRKLCDYRIAFGEMYADEIEGFDFWGHTDLDCVYGRLWEYVTDEMLAEVDIYSNDPYPQMCGPFSLYRTETASHFFREHDGWQDIFADPKLRFLNEIGSAATIAASGLRVRHEHFEGPDSMYVHFTSTKSYPNVPAGFLP